MVKKIKVDDVVFKSLDLAKAFLTGLTQAHPTSLGLLIMLLSTAVINTTKDAGVKTGFRNLYGGAQTVAVAAAVAPVVSGGLGALTAVLERKK